MKATGVARCVISARSISASAVPAIQVAASGIGRLGHDE
jgi:hypothetical protein